MDANIFSNETVKHSLVCYPVSDSTSSGVWFGDKPLSFGLPRILAQVSLIFTIQRVLYLIIRPFGLSQVVSQILAGGVMGLSGLTQDELLRKALFPRESKMQIDVLATMGVMLFLFMIGVKTDISTLRKSGGKAVAIGLVSSLLPFTLMVLVAYGIRSRLPPQLTEGDFIYHFSATWARTSYSVLSCFLDEFNLLNSKLGRLAMSATLVSEFNTTVLTSITTALQIGTNARSTLLGLGSGFSLLALLAFIFAVARPITLWIIRRTPDGEQMKEGYLNLILIMALACGFAGEVIGYHASTGTFILGLALPGGPPLGTTLQDKIDTVLSGILVPQFLATAGFRAEIPSLVNTELCWYVVFFVLLGLAAKTAGLLVLASQYGIPMQDAVTLALMMNTKGIFEIHAMNVWKDALEIHIEVYTVVVICIVVICAITSCMVNMRYKPCMDYLACKRRTIQQAKREPELRVLACIYNPKDVTPVVDLLHVAYSSKRSPVCIYALHLMPLVGHAAAMLAPYRTSHRGSGSSSSGPTDRVINAFRHLETENKNAAVQPFVAISPTATMHEDVCTLALDKKVYFVILPFHVRPTISGTMEASNVLKNMNLNVLNYAPCSVGIFVDRGLSAARACVGPYEKVVVHHVAVYFLGGADDREALAVAAHMVENPAVRITVVRFLLPRALRKEGPEEALDADALRDFRDHNRHNPRVAYEEEVAEDAEGTVGVIRAITCRFSLLIVGRRGGADTPLTKGLLMWSDYPEMGAVGDMLTSMDLGCEVSTLVVQQQNRVGALEREGRSGDVAFSSFRSSWLSRAMSSG